MQRLPRPSTLALLVVIGGPFAARAQDPSETNPYTHAVATWIGLLAAPGHERAATQRILDATNGWTRDGMGNLVKRVGAGSPRRVILGGPFAARAQDPSETNPYTH